ncbi:MAG TPA: heavy metal-binding domain-containing protein [Solirubrobacteraceae bacterium]
MSRDPEAGAPREPSTPDATLEAEQAESLRRVEAGGIPLNAERRLKELDERGGSFTSDLSVGSFALCHQLGLKPLSQVMGSSIYQIGYQGMQMGYGAFGGGGTMGMLTELRTLSDAWNEVRRLALNRLELEARHAGADAVIGVQLRTGSHDWAEGAIEYVVVGTAVRRKDAKPSENPVMTELSVSDYANLQRAGIEPLGIVAWTSVFFVVDTAEMQMMSGFGGRAMFSENQELSGYTQGVYSAREQAMERLGFQAQQLGASGIVGVRIGHTMRRQNIGGGVNTQRSGMVVTFDVIGTAVRDRNEIPQQAPKTTVDISS